MTPFITHQQLRDFEDKIGYKNLLEKNKKIALFLEFTPEIEWMVGTNDGSCFHPKSCGFNDVDSQKREAERWLLEQKQKFPNGWVLKEGNQVVKREYYPKFHSDWNFTVEAIKRMWDKKIFIAFSMNIFYAWETILENIPD